MKDRTLADRIVRAQNEGLAKFVAQYPDRFVAMASSSLQFPDLAAQQLEDGVKRLGLRAAAIGGHVNGEDLSLPKFDVFWAKAAELGVVPFMHPGGAENIVRDGGLDGRGDLGNIIGNPLETTYFLSRLIFDGVFDRHPNLKVAAAHGGGYLPSYLMRTDVACEVRNNANCANKKRPKEYMRSQIIVDTMVLSDEGLQAPGQRNGRQPDRLRDRQPAELAGHRRFGAQCVLAEQRRQGSHPGRKSDQAAAHHVFVMPRGRVHPDLPPLFRLHAASRNLPASNQAETTLPAWL